MTVKQVIDLLVQILQANQGNKLTIETINGILFSVEQHLPKEKETTNDD